MFKKLYSWTLGLSANRFAVRWLATIGFIESIFFPIPGDILLIPMCLARRDKSFRYALVLSIASVLGGVVGYGLGHFFSDMMTNFLINVLHKGDAYNHFKEWFSLYGFAIVFAAGFTPIPYKVVTIMSGIMAISFPIFFIASMTSRPLRFYLLAAAVYFGGEKLEKKIEEYIEWLGWICVVAVVVLGIYLLIKN